VTVNAGTDEKAPVEMGSDFITYPVTTSSQSLAYEKVVIDYSQDCLGLAGCELPVIDLGQLPDGVAVVHVGGQITLSGSYDAINQVMLNNLSIKPGAGNPYDVKVMVTASVTDTNLGTTVTDFDSFIIPINWVSGWSNGNGWPLSETIH